MEKNVGDNDRIIRGVIALIVAVFGYIYTPWLYLISAILLITAILGFCWPYTLFGINTRKK